MPASSSPDCSGELAVLALDSFPLGISILDGTGRILFTNTTGSRFLGLTVAEHLLRTIDSPEWKIIHADGSPYRFEDLPGYRAFHEKIRIEEPEMGVFRPDGEIVWLSVTAAPLGPDQVVLTYGNITKDQKALRVMIANVSDVVAIIGLDGTTRFKSPNVERLFGWRPEELVGQSAFANIHPQDFARVQGNFGELLSGQRSSVKDQCQYRCKDGSYRWIEFTAANLMEIPEIQGVLLNYHDITPQVDANKALVEAEWKFRALFEEGPIGVAYHRMIYDDLGQPVDYFFIDANEKYIELTGVDPRGMTVTQAFPGIENDPFDWIGTWGHVARTGETLRFEQHLEVNDRWYDCVGYQYAPDHFVAAFLEITDRKRAEKDLQRMTDRLKLATKAGGVGIWEWDLATDKLIWDEQMYGLYGVSESHFSGAYDAWKSGLHPDDVERGEEETQKALRGEKDFDTEVRVIWPDGSVHNIRALGDVQRDDSGKPLRMIGTNWDITASKKAEEHQRQLEAQLQQSQKMESLGTLAGGVAHDMNNVLGAILGLASVQISTLPIGSPLYQALDTIAKAAERGGKMVKSLLRFARMSHAEHQVLDINDLLGEQVELLKHTVLAQIRIQLDLEQQLWPMEGDPSALTHAFMNLCVNAVDAMTEGGTLTLHTRNLDGWIEVEVEDDGVGMPKEVLEKALDPFFTTKGVGKGTGLGLSMVFSTVKAHQGQMTIDSQPGQGTRVTIRLPAYQPQGESPRIGNVAGPATTPPRNSLRVLLVDDDDLVQLSMVATLNFLGHTAVTTVPSGEEALAVLEAGLQPDLVILDMNMPGLGGAATLPRLRQLRPTVPVILATGRADQAALDLVATHHGVTLLAKPFSLIELQKHLEDLGLHR